MMGGLAAASIGPASCVHDLIAKPHTVWRIMRYSQAHTSTRLAAQAASNATVSVTCTRSQEFCRVIFMAGKTSGDSTRRVSRNIFPGIQDSFTTQGLSPRNGPIHPESACDGAIPKSQDSAQLRT